MDFILNEIEINKEAMPIYIRIDNRIIKSKLENIFENIIFISIDKDKQELIRENEIKVYFKFQDNPMSFTSQVTNKKVNLFEFKRNNPHIEIDSKLSEKYLNNNNKILVTIEKPEFLSLDLSREYERIPPPHGVEVSLKMEKDFDIEELKKKNINPADPEIQNAMDSKLALEELNDFLNEKQFKYKISLLKTEREINSLEKIAVFLEKFLCLPISEEEDRLQNPKILNKLDIENFLKTYSKNSTLNESELSGYDKKNTDMGFTTKIFIPLIFKKYYIGFLEIYSKEPFDNECIEKFIYFSKAIPTSFLKELVKTNFLEIRKLQLKNISGSGMLLICSNNVKHLLSIAKNIKSTIIFQDKSVFKFDANIAWEEENLEDSESFVVLRFENIQKDVHKEFLEKIYGVEYDGRIDRIGGMQIEE